MAAVCMESLPKTTTTTPTTTSSGELLISIPLPDPSEATPSWFRTCSSILHHMHVGIFLAAYASLIGLLQLKYKKESTFETHSCFMTMSVVAIIMFAVSYWILDYKGKNFSNSCVYNMILVSVALFSAILALLSLVLVLLVPPTLIWIGYALLCVLVIVVIAYNFIDNYMRDKL